MMTALNTALVLLLLQTPAPSQPQAPKASVAGVVLNTNGEPIPNVRVTLGRIGMNLGPFTQVNAGERERTISADEIIEIANIMTESGDTSPDGVARAAAFKSIPVKEVYEITVTPTGGTSVVSRSSPPALTDDRGRFSFDAVDPGTYRITFSGNGYAKQDYGQRTFGASGLEMPLTPGQSKTDLVMRMARVGSISGHVLDGVGQPVVGVAVEVFRLTYDKTGQKKKQLVAVARTDELGDYRVHSLSPSLYYVSGGGQAGLPERPQPGRRDALLGVGYSTPNRIPQFYTTAYYPGTADENSAAAIDVQSGADLRGVDLFVSLPQPYRIRGRVVDSRTGQPPQSVTFTLGLRDPGGRGNVNLLGINPSYKAADGSFEVQNINAGAYFITASIPDANPIRPADPNTMSPEERVEFFRALEAADLARPGVSLPLNVNADVNGVVLAVGIGGSFTGRLRVESNDAGSTPVSFNSVRVQLMRPADALNPIEAAPQSGAIGADGTFRINYVRSGDYTLSVVGMPAAFYLKDARLGETDVLQSPLRYNPGDDGVLTVLISPRTGVIDGAVLDAAGQPAPGAQVVLIPNRNRERTELFRTMTADTLGRFAMTSIAPGEYTLAAWEALEPYAFFDPALIRQSQTQGKAVRVEESSSQKVEITAIR